MGDCHGGFVFALVCAQHRLRIDGNHLWPAKNTINVRHGLQYLYTVVDDVWLTVTTRHNKLATTLGDWSTPSRGNEMCYACNPISTILQLSKHPNSVIIDKNLRRQTRVLRQPEHAPKIRTVHWSGPRSLTPRWVCGPQLKSLIHPVGTATCIPFCA